MIEFGTLVLNGLTIAMTLFLSAAGLTLLFGILRILNFAHGTFIMMGAYLASMLLGRSVFGPTKFVLCAVAVGVCMMAVGVVVDRLVFRRLRNVDEANALVATFALMLFVHGVAKLIWGTDFISVDPPAGLQAAFIFNGLIVPQFSVFLWGTGIVVFIILEIVIERLWIGKVLQSAAKDPWIVAIMGYDVSRLVLVAVLFSFFLAGFAGGILLPNQTLQQSLADTFIVQAFAVVIIGGLGSIRGAFLASLLLGMAESIGSIVMPSLALYVGMIVILLFRPNGLAAAGAAATIEGITTFFDRRLTTKAVERQRNKRTETSRSQTATPVLREQPGGGFLQRHALSLGLVLLALATLASAPFWGGGGVMYVAGFVLIDTVFALSWNMLFGYAGLATFGHAAFFAAGAYFVAFFLKAGTGAPFLLLLIGAGCLGALIAAPLGAIALRRSSGLQLAILTLALSEVFRILVSYSARLGRDEGLTAIPRPVLSIGSLSISLASEVNYFWFLCLACTIAIGLMWWLSHSGLGRVLRSIREDAGRASFIGINIHRYRWLAFVLASGFAALAGGLSAPLTQIVTPESAGMAKSTAPMLSTLLGGASTFWGPFVGTLVFATLQYSTRTLAGLSELVMGSILLVVILTAPAGIVGSLSQFFRPNRPRDQAVGIDKPQVAS